MPDLDLEELKRLLAEAEFTPEDLDVENAIEISRTYGLGPKAIAAVAAASALPELIARAEWAEVLRASIDHALLVEIAGRIGPHPKFRQAAHALNLLAEQQRHALTGDTPNV